MVGIRNIPSAELEPVAIKFGEWLPDLGDLDNPGALEALNVIPIAGGYKPFRQIDASPTLVLADKVRGGVFYYDRTGTLGILAATTEGLYQNSGSTTFVERYTLTIDPDSMWRFVLYGWNIVALPPGDVPLVTSVGGDLSFSPLGGSPPIAQCGARIGDFLVLGNLDNEPDEPRQPSRIRWSGFNNIEAPWVSDPATQADFQDMPSEGGAVKAITGREFGTVFQERCISRMTYTGDEAVFDIQTVESERGAMSTGGVVDLGSIVYFIATDGFCAWNGTNSVPIGDHRVSEYFFSRLNFQLAHLIVGGVDPINRCVFWAFPTGDSHELTEVIIYSLKEEKFSHAMVDVDYMMNAATLGITLEEISGPLETVSPPLDSPFYKGGVPALAGFRSSDHSYGLFVGVPMEATIDTGLYTGPSQERVFTDRVRPLVDCTTLDVTVQAMTKDQHLGQSYDISSPVGQEIDATCPLIAEGRFVRFRTKIPAGKVWTYARGIEISRQSNGKV